MTDRERQTLAQIARRLLRDGHISDVEAAWIGSLLQQQPQAQHDAQADDRSDRAQP